VLVAACGSKAPFGDACQPGTLRCDRNAYQQCSDDGNRWQTLEECAPLGRVCVPNAGGCLACNPDSRSCGGDGFDITLCRRDGSGSDLVARCEPEQGLVCSVGSCRAACAVAEDTRSYEGCDYWAVDLDNAVVSELGAAAAQQFSVVVTNPLEVPAQVTVEVNDAPPGAPPQIREVARVHLARVRGGGDLAVINLDPREVDGSTDPRLNDGPGSFLSSNAYRLRSTAPIIAYQFNPLENVNVFSNDASLLLPTRSLDREYAVLSWPQTLAVTSESATNGNIHLRAFLTVVGMEPQTTVSITLSTATIPGPGIPAGQPGDTLRFALGPHDVINLETGGFNADFSGSRVVADKPVAVFTGGEASDVPSFTTFAERDCCADHLEEQLFPTSAFGTEFVAVKTPSRTRYVRAAGMNVALVEDEPEYWRLLATRDDTDVTTSLLPPNNRFNLRANQVVTIEATRDFVVQTSRPVSFAQFPASAQTTGIPTTVEGTRAPNGDPSSIMVPPIGQWRNKYVFLTPNKYTFDFLLIAMPATSGLRFDGEELMTILPRCEYRPAGGVRIGGAPQVTEFVAIRCPLSDPVVEDLLNPIYQNDGRHVLESVDGQRFGLVVYGWDSYVSYGYPAGTDVRAINIEIQ
jgi:hypothetical protein